MNANSKANVSEKVYYHCSLTYKVTRFGNCIIITSAYRFQIDEVNTTFLEISLRIKVCLEENSCVYDIMLLDRQIIPKPGCSWDLSYTIPGLHFYTSSVRNL